MQKTLKNLFVKTLRETADKVDAGNTNLSEEEMIDIVNAIVHQAISKEQACSYLGLSRSRFDDLVRTGKLPKGRKRRGFKELVFYKDELNYFAEKRKAQ